MRTGIVKEPHKVIPVGTCVACDKGHHLCDTTAPLLLSAPFVPEKQLDNWQMGYKPRGDDAFPLRCPECGAPWMVLVPDRGIVIHFQMLGWWPFEPPDAFMTALVKRKWWQFWKPKYARVSVPVRRPKNIARSAPKVSTRSP